MKQYIVFDLATFKFFCRIAKGLVSTEEYFTTLNYSDSTQEDMIVDALHLFNLLEDNDFSSYGDDYDYEE